MHKPRLLLLVALVSGLVGIALISFFVGDSYAVGNLSVRQVTPDQLAQAMKADQFYSDFRETTLVVQGRVASVYRNDGAITLEFFTPVGIKTLCGLQEYPTTNLTGKTVTVITEGANAQRIPSGVLLNNCIIENP